jgi:hypothetical protein
MRIRHLVHHDRRPLDPERDDERWSEDAYSWCPGRTGVVTVVTVTVPSRPPPGPPRPGHCDRDPRHTPAHTHTLTSTQPIASPNKRNVVLLLPLLLLLTQSFHMHEYGSSNSVGRNVVLLLPLLPLLLLTQSFHTQCRGLGLVSVCHSAQVSDATEGI